ncbi:MAG: hypothetical protein WKF76_02595 [Nocardioidaceae bacterium]
MAASDDSLPEGFAGKRGSYELTQFVPLAAMLVLGLIFYALGTPTRRRTAAPPPESERVPANT